VCWALKGLWSNSAYLRLIGMALCMSSIVIRMQELELNLSILWAGEALKEVKGWSTWANCPHLTESNNLPPINSKYEALLNVL
jgi:hypothetical protein